MAKSREHFALDWTKGELLETLNDARQALEAFVESDRDETRMRSCLTGLHQVHGTLVMLELSGVTMLADHLERLAQNMLSGRVDDESAAAQLLMQGILELPGHLDEIQAGGSDDLRAVASLVNEIRAELGEQPLQFGAPVTSIARGASAASLSRFEDIDGAEKTRRIRAAYQQVLLNILKGEDLAAAIDMLGKVARSLQRVCLGTPHEQQWAAFGEFVASLENRKGPLSADSVKLLRRVDSEIRALGQDGVDSLKEPVSLELIRQLLDAARSGGRTSELMDSLEQALEASGGPVEAFSPSGRQALSSAAAALREELLLVKDRLDLIVRAGGEADDQLQDLIAPLKQIGSTLSMLGFESSRQVIADQIEALADAEEGPALDASGLLNIASALVQVDENLASFSPGDKNDVEKIVDEAQRAVTAEARQGLDQVKQDVVDFISSKWDPRHLKETSARIAEICGALEMIPLSRAVTLLARCGEYVVTSLAAGRKPAWEELDRFADAVSGLDYYLERIGEATGYGVEDVLDLVDRSLDTLEAAASSAVTAAAEAAAVPPSTAAAFGGDSEPVVELPGDVEHEEEEPALELDHDPGFDLSGADFDQMGGPTRASPLQASGEASEPVLTSASLPPGHTPRVDPSLRDSFESDEEIVEIFVEELGEVLEAVDEWLPLLAEDARHEEALTEIRRAFHTLKGSGRIVGANIIGELAWSVENMLNRLIDATVEPTAQFVRVVAQARALVPALKDAFETQQAPDMGPVGLVMELADILASGGSLEEAGAQEAEQPPAALVETAEPQADAAGKEVPVESEEEEARLVFLGEAEGHLAVLTAGLDGNSVALDESFLRALHTLSGSAGMANISSIEELARPTCELASVLRGATDKTITGEAADYLRRAVGALQRALAALRAGETPADELQLIAEADHLIVAAGEATQASDAGDRVALMSLDALSEVMGADEFLRDWKDGAMDLAYGDRLTQALTEVRDAAEKNGIEPMVGLAASLAGALARLADDTLSESVFEALQRGHDTLIRLFDALAAEQSLPEVDETIAMLDVLGYGGAETDEASGEPAAPRDDTHANVIVFRTDLEAEGEGIDL
ncbi:MAG TPA: Hpt domain-containing protein, partial [Pseudomonadales bacterium]